MNIGRSLRRWTPVAGIVLLLGGVAISAILTSVEATRLPRLSPPESELAPTWEPDTEEVLRTFGPLAGDETQHFPTWVLTLSIALLLVAMISTFAVVVWSMMGAGKSFRVKLRRFTRPNPQKESAPSVEGARAAVEAGIEALDDPGDPRRAVIACWLGLEAAAADAGTIRESGDTPAELVGRLLVNNDLSRGVLAELTELYRAARYAPHTVDESMRLRARAALTRLHAELSREVAA